MSHAERPRVALVAGELSGDRLGAGLIRALRASNPDITCEGVGGPAMRAAGCEVLFDCEELAVMGLVEVVRHLPRLLRRRRELLRHWQAQPPDVFVGIDAPDFNLGLARRLKLSGVPTVHYVCPSVWAWREKRVKVLRRSLDHVLCLLPFEPDFLGRHDIAASFVGHPLAAEIDAHASVENARAELGLAAGPVLALLPGSRRTEVERLADPFIATARRLAAAIPNLNVVAALATDTTRLAFAARCTNDPSIRVVSGQTRQVLTAATAVLVASGTATLETALHGKPMIVAYRLSPLTYRIVKSLNLVRATHVSLPNILADSPVVPEFIQDAVNVATLAPPLAALLTDAACRQEQTNEFAKLRDILAQDADARSAHVVESLLSAQRSPNAN
ncbi:MAG: lipid-A-disaccharide synthase [Pseudomonadota bacterium]